jgi:cellulose synthase operon protein B
MMAHDIRLMLLLGSALATGGGQAFAQGRAAAPQPTQTAAAARTQLPAQTAVPAAAARPATSSFISLITLADIGIGGGIRFANLGGRREIFIPLPQGADIVASELVLTLDDVTAHAARRSLEVLVNDHTVSAVALDGRSSGRVLRVPLETARGRDQFLKLTFVYSGAVTQDRCIDVHYVGDSLTIRPESSVELMVAPTGGLDVATTAALLPRDVAVVLPARPLLAADIAAALTVGRSLAASGRRVAFHSGFAELNDPTRHGDPRRWTRGVVVVGTADDVAAQLDTPIATVAGPIAGLGALTAVRIGGLPALLVSDASAIGTGQLLASPWLAATRGVPAVSIAEASAQKRPADRVSFEQLGLAPALAEVFGRAELSVVVNTRALPARTRMSRLGLDIMVAPDGAGERAVVSAFVNDNLLASTVAATGEPTRLDLAVPDGLVGNVANIRAVVQRRSPQGDCRFEPQGYPAQLLGSSFIGLSDAGARLQDFSDLSARWSEGVEVLVPEATSQHPLAVLGMLSSVLSALTPTTAPIKVGYVAADAAPAPQGAWLAVGNAPPATSTPRVRFDRGRVAVSDRSGRALLDIGGLASGAVVQLMSAGTQPGMWIKPLAADGVLPDPVDLRIERGDVAVLDKIGTALALSTERDTLVQISYPDQTSWLTVAERIRPWMIGAIWALGTILFLRVLQRLFRRRARAAGE